MKVAKRALPKVEFGIVSDFALHVLRECVRNPAIPGFRFELIIDCSAHRSRHPVCKLDVGAQGAGRLFGEGLAA